MLFCIFNEEMMSLISCLERFNKDQAMCVDEINHFNRCFVKFRETQAIEKEKKAKADKLLEEQTKTMTTGQTDRKMERQQNRKKA